MFTNMYMSSLVLLEEGVCHEPVHFLGKTLLAFALLHFVLHGQIFLLLQVCSYFGINRYTQNDSSLMNVIFGW